MKTTLTLTAEAEGIPGHILTTVTALAKAEWRDGFWSVEVNTDETQSIFDQYAGEGEGPNP